jgi:hypothetical protein
MQQLTVIENVTLDGVMQAPGRADEDTRDGFRDGTPPASFRLASGTATTTGVIMATLRPADRQEDR